MVAPDQDSNPENFQATEQASHGSTDEPAMHKTVSLDSPGDEETDATLATASWPTLAEANSPETKAIMATEKDQAARQPRKTKHDFDDLKNEQNLASPSPAPVHTKTDDARKIDELEKRLALQQSESVMRLLYSPLGMSGAIAGT